MFLKRIKITLKLFLIGSLCYMSYSSMGKEKIKIYYADSLTKIHYDGSNINSLGECSDIYIDLAKEEAQSFQLVLLPREEKIDDVKVELENSSNNLFFDWRKVEWVKTANPSYPTSYVGYWPDPLLRCESFNISKNRVQPLWFTVKTSPKTKAGIHRLKINIIAENFKKSFYLHVKVRDFILPRTLPTTFGLYAKKISEWYYGSKNYRKFLKIKDYMKWAKLMMEYRLCPKAIGQEYARKKTGKVSLASLNNTLGIIAKDMPPYSYSLFRLPSGFTIEKRLKEKSINTIVKNLTKPALEYWKAWQNEKFPEEVYIYGIDEPEKNPKLHKTLQKTYRVIKKDVPKAKILQTIGSPAPHLVGLVDIWVPKTECAWDNFFQERSKSGDVLWNYVCVSPVHPYPNFFIDVPAIEHRILFWQTSKINATGFLYWSVNWYDGFESPASGKPSFPDVRWDFANHCQYSSSWVHVNGDGVLVYPGKNLEPIPSIRLAAIRDGIQDYEYIALLKKLIKKVEQIPIFKTADGDSLIKAAKELAKVPDDIISSPKDFTYNPLKIFKRRSQIANMIEQLKNVLDRKQYHRWKNYQKTIKK